jgi:3-dehydroquinate dehydratase II
MKILVIHGPNLNILGKREPEVYGSLSLVDIEDELKGLAEKGAFTIKFFQSNHEGEIVTKIQEADGDFDALVINPAAFTHTSVAIRDALAAVALPAVEIHLSNIYSREEFRRTSLTAPVVKGVIMGFGKQSYILGVQAAVSLVK